MYRHARIEPGRRYRITGNMHGCDDFIIALRAGFMHNDIWGTKATITAHDLGLGRHDDFEILLGGDESDAVAIPDGVLSASIREYYFDWTRRRAGLLHHRMPRSRTRPRARRADLRQSRGTGHDADDRLH